VDDQGCYTFVGRADDVFKSSGYRISPFELESVLIEHPAVAEAAVVPIPDAMRHTIPKAYVSLVAGASSGPETALDIFRFTNARLATFKRLRGLEFVADLPKTISGKIRRVQLRRLEHEGVTDDPHRGRAYTQADFPELKGEAERKLDQTAG
jgi:acetyl-CoA synthetase